jgi:hypothetical protein
MSGKSFNTMVREYDGPTIPLPPPYEPDETNRFCEGLVLGLTLSSILWGAILWILTSIS